MTAKFTVAPMADDEIPLWAAMRQKLWPDCTDDDNQIDIRSYTEGGAVKLVLIAKDGGAPIGFAEISERSVVDSCPGPSAYLEGWWVRDDWRSSGVGGALIRAAADWAREQHYECFGSDVELHNEISQKAHAALGFEETGRVVTYRMVL